MPLYEYRCCKCGKTFEKLQARPETSAPCPDCGRPSEKAVSVFAASASTCDAPSGSGFG